jgi:hypothetical protein
VLVGAASVRHPHAGDDAVAVNVPSRVTAMQKLHDPPSLRCRRGALDTELRMRAPALAGLATMRGARVGLRVLPARVGNLAVGN